MRINNNILYTLLFVLLSLCGSCSKNDNIESSDTSVVIYNVNSLFGTIRYNNNISRWFISTNLEGTIDCGVLYFPFSLESKYQEEGMRVIFSGEVYKMNSSLQQDVQTPAGTLCFMIDIKSINKE